MKMIDNGFSIINPPMETHEEELVARKAIYDVIERAARTCYKSQPRDPEDQEEQVRFLQTIVKNKHEAMLEHAVVTVVFYVDRGVTHEVVRHRIASFAQESTRYCNYQKQKFGSDVTYINISPGIDNDPVTGRLPGQIKRLIYQEWLSACADAEMHYMKMLDLGASPQIARSVLNHSTKSELVVTMNIREWRHFINLRAEGTTGKPHPQMEIVAKSLEQKLYKVLPDLFFDIVKEEH